MLIYSPGIVFKKSFKGFKYMFECEEIEYSQSHEVHDIRYCNAHLFVIQFDPEREFPKYDKATCDPFLSRNCVTTQSINNADRAYYKT